MEHNLQQQAGRGNEQHYEDKVNLSRCA